MNSDTKTLAQASLFRRMRALCRTMRKGTQWKLYCDEIRHGNQCPLTFIGDYTGAMGSHAREAARKIGLENFAAMIIVAADSEFLWSGNEWDIKKHWRMRRILLRAAGLNGQQTTPNTPRTGGG